MARIFADVIRELFPPISEDTKKRLKELLLQHKNNPYLIFATSLNQVISQGDIISNIPFLTLQEDETYLGEKHFAMLISHTCDFANDNTILFAPAYTIDLFKECFGNNEGLLNSLRDNLIYDKFYLPERDAYPELVVDFNGINSVSKKYILKNLEDKNSDKIASLSQEGYYYLITKLTVHFLRPENSELIREETI